MEVFTNPFREATEEFTLNTNSYQAINLTPFKGIFSHCFEPYLHIYLDFQDRNLAEMISRVAGDLGSQGAAPFPDGDLFVCYRKCLVSLQS